MGTSWTCRKPPTELQASAALEELENILRPKRVGKQKRYKESSEQGWALNLLQRIQMMLNLYTSTKSKVKGQWMEASLQASQACGKHSKYAAEKLREKAKEFISSRKVPESPYGAWNISKIDTDEDLKQELSLFLQSKGKYVRANDIIEYLKDPEVLKRWELTKPISQATAKRWMKKLEYRWVKRHRGLYFDGHERPDVVDYRQNRFLPTWFSLWPSMQKFDKDGNEEPLELMPGGCRVVPWFHDESVYYANDRRQSQWVHKDSSAAPYTKGEGHSEMVSEFFSPDFGYLRSSDGSQSARLIWKPGKNRDGYFDNQDFMKQVDLAMDILQKDYPGMTHMLIFDNATIHLKRPEDALSARKMPKFTPAPGKNWGVEVSKRGQDGKIINGPDNKPIKIKVRMRDGWFNGQPQSLYFEEGHPRAGTFKGMAVILQQRGYTEAINLPAQCKDFKCPPDADRCCCRRLLYNQPDFVNVKSVLEEHCEHRGFLVQILPKYHCELNPLEMVWGRSKFHYRLNPPSSKEEDLHQNVINALDMVTLTEMRRYMIFYYSITNMYLIHLFPRFSRRSVRFMDAYRRGLNAKQAAWANKKYRGHRVLPESIMKDLDEANMID